MRYSPVLLLFLAMPLFSQTQAVYFADYPCLTPDGQTIIFSYESDLWKVDTKGGLAIRITAMDGHETRPKISPDGNWLAFTGNQYGNNDIFIMPLAGGPITQLTYHQASDQLASWTWDSQSLYFTSDRYNRMSTYQIKIKGGTPSRVFEHYFNNIHNAVAHPTSNELFFNETWESSSFAHRKGYKGAYNPDIKSYNLKTGAFTQYTDYEGKDFDVTIDRHGQVYFVSDEFNGEYNLYMLEDSKKKRLTRLDHAIYHPVVNANGGKIVFQSGYQLHVHDVKNGKTEKVAIKVVQNRTLDKTKDFNVSGKISDFDVASDGKKLAFVSRGELFVSDIEGKFIRQLPTRTDGRVLEVHWLKGDKSLIFNQTVGGYQNWFKIEADGKSQEQQLTNDQKNNRNLSFNSDKSQAVYLSGREELRLLEVEKEQSKLLAKAELWGFYNDLPHFASDNQHIVFSAYKNFEREIMVYNLKDGQLKNLSNTGVTEASPFWSPDGKYLYFISNRTKPSYPFGLQDANIYRVALEKYDQPYRSDKFDELFVEEEKEKTDKEETQDSTKTEVETKAEKKDSTKKLLNIDYSDILERLESIGPRFGTQGSPFVIQKDDKTTIIYSSNHDEGSYNLWKTVLEPFEKPKTEKIKGADTGGATIKEAKGKYYALLKGNIHKLDLGGNKVEKINISYKFRRQLQPEFEQMFFETWANLEENFYNGDFHGVDWPAIRDHYGQFLPHITNRADLRRMLNDMLGELNTSHFGFYSNGDEEKIYYGTRSISTGLLFENDRPYTIAHIVAEGPADRKDKDVRPGDRLMAINGKAIDPSVNREFYFASPSMDEEVLLTLKRGNDTIECKIHPVSYTTIRNLLYDEWMDSCQKRVDEKTKKQVAYIHMKNMGQGELQRFLTEMVAEGHDRNALILDLRYNTGGNVHDEVLRFLSQRPYLQWKYRDGALTPQPNFGPAAKPMVLLINEQSLSDAEMTATGFKELGLGKIIGTETYRWIIFTSGKGLVDGSFYRLPSWGCYTLDGKNIEKTGVAPDIYIKNSMKDRLEGRDPQLDKAIEMVLGELE